MRQLRGTEFDYNFGRDIAACRIWLTPLVLMSWCFQCYGANDTDGQIDALIRQNDDARSRIRFISFTYSKELRTAPQNSEPFEDVVIGKVKEGEGCKSWITDQKYRMKDSAGKQLPPKRVEKHMVLNENYLATWNNGTGDIIQQFDHSSLASIPQENLMRIHDVGEDVLQFAFGQRNSTLRLTYERQKTSGRWAVEESELAHGEKLLRIARYWTQGGKPWLMHCWDLDARSGLVRKFRAYVSPDELAEEHEVTPKEAAPGIFVPAKIVYNQYFSLVLRGKSATSEERRKLYHTETIVLSDVVINEPIAAGNFTLAQIGAPEGRAIAHTHLNGQSAMEYLWGGIGVPPEVNDEFLGMRIMRRTAARKSPLRTSLLIVSAATLVALIWIFVRKKGHNNTTTS